MKKSPDMNSDFSFHRPFFPVSSFLLYYYGIMTLQNLYILSSATPPLLTSPPLSPVRRYACRQMARRHGAPFAFLRHTPRRHARVAHADITAARRHASLLIVSTPQPPFPSLSSVLRVLNSRRRDRSQGFIRYQGNT
jgi:hypothetical protein